jgi:DNA-binding CsgD family transcriptional regulator
MTDEDRFRRLTDKQRECLDLVVQRKTSKQIARILGISKTAVDARLATARQYLGVADRDAAALAYGHMVATYDRVTCDPAQLAPAPRVADERDRDTVGAPAFLLREAPTSFGSYAAQARWSPHVLGVSLHELGSVARLAVIAALPVGGLAALLIALAVAQVLTRLFGV